jgi:hypothetical protein
MHECNWKLLHSLQFIIAIHLTILYDYLGIRSFGGIILNKHRQISLGLSLTVAIVLLFPLLLCGGNLSEITLESSVLPLSKEWNFISFPRLPSDHVPIETAFRDVSHNVCVVWGFDNLNKEWLKYRPSLSSTLNFIDFGKGYWVYMNNPGSINMESWLDLVEPTTIRVYEGWNLIGFKRGLYEEDVSTALDKYKVKWSIVWNWADGQWYAKHANIATFAFPGLAYFKPTRAYWLKVSSAVDICSSLNSLPCIEVGSTSLYGNVGYNNGIDILTVTLDNVRFFAYTADGAPTLWVSGDVSLSYTDASGSVPLKTSVTLNQTPGPPMSATFILEEFQSQAFGATITDGSAPSGIGLCSGAFEFMGIATGQAGTGSKSLVGNAVGKTK